MTTEVYWIDWEGSRKSDGAPLNVCGSERLIAFIDNGILVPDTRLQAIADAWNAHLQTMGESQYRETLERLHELLDALFDERP